MNAELLRRLDAWKEGESAGPLIRWAAAHLRGCGCAEPDEASLALLVTRVLEARFPVPTGPDPSKPDPGQSVWEFWVVYGCALVIVTIMLILYHPWAR